MTKASLLPKEKKEQLIREAYLKATIEMAGAAAHELAQPLTVLMMRCEILKSYTDGNPAIKENIKLLLSSVEKIGNIVHKIQSINTYSVKKYVGTSTIIDLEKSADSDKDAI